MMSRWGYSGLILVIALALVGPGCRGKKTPAPEEGTGLESQPLGGPGIPEGSIGSFATTGRPHTGGPLSDIQFDYDSFELSATSRQILQQNADWLRKNSKARIEVEGYCDSRGTVEYNLALGAKRASAAKTYLVSLGVSGDRMTTISYGEELPLCEEQTESCWHQNRRVHFYVLEE